MMRYLLMVFMVGFGVSPAYAFTPEFLGAVCGGGVTLTCGVTTNVVTGYVVTLQSAALYTMSRFSPISNVTVCKVDLNLSRHASETSNFILEIRTDNAGTPSETVLATSDVVATSSLNTTPANVAFIFSSTPSLSSGTTYHFVLRKVGTTTGYNINIESGESAQELVASSTTGLIGSWTNISATKAGLYIIYGMQP